MSKRKSLSLADWLGFRQDIKREDTRWFGGILGTALVGLGLFLLCLFVAMLVLMVLAMSSVEDKAEDVRNIGLVLTAIVGAPFLAWRSYVAAKQVDIAEESLFNDKINAAATDLAARRQVTTVLGEGDKREVITEWKDDLVTRAAAIDRLEGLAIERPDTAPRIARMLSIYARELSAEHPALDHPRVEYLRRTEQQGQSPSQVMEDLGMGLDEETVKHQTAWAKTLKPIRSDMEKAAQTLGRLRTIDGVDPDDIPIDLRGANLQGFDLRKLSFPNAQFDRARMEGADLRGARMEGARLIGARMEGANLSWAGMTGAHLRNTGMEGAHLRNTEMEGTDLSGARMVRGGPCSSTSLQPS